MHTSTFVYFIVYPQIPLDHIFNAIGIGEILKVVY
jgi:hypothetical protein